VIDLELIREHLRYEPESGQIFWTKKAGRRSVVGAEAGTVTTQGYRMVTLCGEMCFAHRIAWFFQNGELPSTRLDHVNGDRLDNRIANLRQADAFQNRWNSRRVGQKLPKGVSQHHRKFRALITARGHRSDLGYFDTPEEAHEAYRAAAEKLHGEFARAA
jgi:hypothetical protein